MSELDDTDRRPPRSSSAAARAASARRRRRQRSGCRRRGNGRRCVVVTIDPAKRLADALGVPGGLTNDPIRLAVDGARRAVGADARHRDDVRRPGHGQRRRRPSRPSGSSPTRFYRNIAGSLSGTQEYMAAERLLALHRDERFDLVIVDTPPTRNALDFLDAPGTLARFLDHPVFKLLMMPTRRGLRVLNVAAQPMLRTIGKVIGGEVLADALAFFQAFDGMETGLPPPRRRGDRAAARRRHAASCSSPRRASTRSTRPASSPTGCVEQGPRGRRDHRQPGDARLRRARPASGRGAMPTPRCTTTWRELHDARRRRARADRTAARRRPAVQPTWVPLLPGDVHDLDALDTIRALLFAGSAAAQAEPVTSAPCTSWSPPTPTTSSTTSPPRSAGPTCRSPCAATGATCRRRRRAAHARPRGARPADRVDGRHGRDDVAAPRRELRHAAPRAGADAARPRRPTSTWPSAAPPTVTWSSR